MSELVPNYLNDILKTDMVLLSHQSFGYQVERAQDTYYMFFKRSAFVIGQYFLEDGTWNYD